MSTSAICIKELIFQYPVYPGLPDVPLFEGLSLDVKPGEFCLILGAPDQGKSTLSRIMAGLLPRYSGGQLTGLIELGGNNIEQISQEQLLKRVGLLFQDPQEQILMTRCDGELAFALEAMGIKAEEMNLRISAALKWMDLDGFEERDPASLSGGEQKKVLLATVKAQDPDIWILDETLEELDVETKRNILKTLVDAGKTVILFASKYIDLLGEYNPNTYLLKEGHLTKLPYKGLEERLLSEGLGFRPGDVNSSLPQVSDAKPGVHLRGQKLTFSYPNASFKLEIPELTLKYGESTAILGQNGSGKSTLAKLLCGLIEPQSGEITLSNGEGEMIPSSGNDRKSNVTYLFQNPDYQLFLPTVNEELVYGMHAKTASSLARDAIERFKLPSGEAPPALLSYGMRKRLQGAIAYMQPRPLIILDEGDSGLSFRDFLTLHDELCRSGATVLLITHNRIIAEALCGNILTMDGGKIVKEEIL